MRKKTKIIATISDRNCEPELIREMFNNGLNIVRLNTAHQDFEGSLKVINNVRSISDKIAILIDTKGPEIRTTNVKSPIKVKENETIFVKGYQEEDSTSNCLFLTYSKFVNDVNVGNKLLINDGDVELEIIEKNEDCLKCVVKNNGVIENHKSINIPGVSINLPALKQKDIEYINFAIENNVDFIAHSFVRRKEDVIAVKSLIEARGSNIKIIAKIENQEGVNNIDEILEYVYGVMVARGDLALEIPTEKIPGIQKMIINKCIHLNKPVIVATQMLHSMISNPRPTRAEVSDVANAVYDGTDAIMLSGETASGKYPLESIQMMTRIAKEVESSTDSFKDIGIKVISTPEAAVLTKNIVEAAQILNMSAIIADTTSGRTIRGLAAYRGKVTIYAQCYDKHTMRELSLSYGVHVDYMEPQKTSHEFIKQAINQLIKKETFNLENTIGVIAGNFGRAGGASYIEISSIKNILSE